LYQKIGKFKSNSSEEELKTKSLFSYLGLLLFLNNFGIIMVIPKEGYL